MLDRRCFKVSYWLRRFLIEEPLILPLLEKNLEIFLNSKNKYFVGDVLAVMLLFWTNNKFAFKRVQFSLEKAAFKDNINYTHHLYLPYEEIVMDFLCKTHCWLVSASNTNEGFMMFYSSHNYDTFLSEFFLLILWKLSFTQIIRRNYKNKV